MIASLWLAAGLLCAQTAPAAETGAVKQAQNAAEEMPAPRAAASKIVSVTVYQGQALVTREVAVPEGGGTMELVITPLPAEVVAASLFSEGTDGLRVLSTRFRTRTVAQDTRQGVRAREDQIHKLEAESQRIRSELTVLGQDLQYLQKLEGFTGSALTALTERGRLDSDAIESLSRFVMESRGTKAKSEHDLRTQLKANTEATELAQKQLNELSAGSSHVEQDAVIVVQKQRPEAGTVRLGYLVSSATWSPQYRLRATAENAPVRLEYLASIVQQTGEPWPDVRITLSNARPSQDAAPPQLMPLGMAVADAVDEGPIEPKDDKSRRLVAELDKPIDMHFPDETPLEDVLKYIQAATQGTAYPEGIPIYVDPVGLQEAEKTMQSPVAYNVAQVPLRTSLRLVLRQLGMTYEVEDGLLTITSMSSEDRGSPDDGTAGFAGMGPAEAAGAPALNRLAANQQEAELGLAQGENATVVNEEKHHPGVALTVSGRLDVPSRRDPIVLEVSRIELPAEYFDKAVPVLTERVYRLAKLTNRSDNVLLPGDATVFVGGEFVGRMPMPLVAAGEQLVAGFGVDPQVQASRRLMQKTRTIQGGNQVYQYEFRIGLRNFRSAPVHVQLWDRLPRPKGETVAVNLINTSVPLSDDAMYLGTARLDNLLRWEVDVPAGTVAEKTMYLKYQFRIEYARDLPQPRFVSGGLREGPIGGGALGMGMGGMGMMSVRPGQR